MRTRIPVVVLLALSLAEVPTVCGTTLHFTAGTGGYCAFTYNAQLTVPTSYYDFDYTHGILTIKKAGQWVVAYQDCPEFMPPGWQPVDIPGINTESGGPGGFTLRLLGANLVGDLNLVAIGATTPYRLRLQLMNGGGVASNVTVRAWYSVVYLSTIPGDVAGYMGLRDIGDPGTGTALHIGGDVTGNIDVFHDVAAVTAGSDPMFRIDGSLASTLHVNGVMKGILSLGSVDGTLELDDFGDSQYQAQVNVTGDMAGSIATGDVINAVVSIGGDVTGSITTGNLSNASINITGDVVDTTTSCLQVNSMTKSHISCHDMCLHRGDGGNFMVLGYGTVDGDMHNVV
jgi:hypothetical protein